MNEAAPKRTLAPSDIAPTRRHLLLSLPAAVASATALPKSSSAAETAIGVATEANDCNSEHIRRFYELARF